MADYTMDYYKEELVQHAEKQQDSPERQQTLAEWWFSCGHYSPQLAFATSQVNFIHMVPNHDRSCVPGGTFHIEQV